MAPSRSQSHSSFLLLLSLVSTFLLCVSAAGKDEWRTRSIYQVMVDRYARPDNSTVAPCNVTDRIYCGGTWKGLRYNLDYIQGMGFDSIWISPMSAGVTGMTGDGSDYTGYWVTDMGTPNPNFGTSQDLIDLSNEVHSRGMFLMLDICVNNMAWAGPPQSVNYGDLSPLNKQEYFHPYCPIDYTNRTSTLDCWMGDDIVALPDINTENSEVWTLITQWINETVTTYKIDGLRIDAAKSIPYDYAQLVNNCTNSYSIGEVFDGDAGYACAYQQNGLDAFLNFPIYYQMLGALYSTTSTQMPAFPQQAAAIKGACPDPTILGNFIECHDVPRFAYYTTDLSLIKNANTWNILWDGIPVVYQGQEQRFRGNGDPYNREALWLSGYATNATIYQLIKFLNSFRSTVIAADNEYVMTLTETLYSDYETVAYLKKDQIMVLSNTGSQGNQYTITIPMASTAYANNGTQFTELLTCNTAKVASTGDFITNIVNGLPQVWYPTSMLQSINFKCGCPEGDDNPTNTYADGEQAEGTHDPYGGTTFTPSASPNAAGMGIAGLNRLKAKQRRNTGVERAVVVVNDWTRDIWALGWAVMGALFVFAL